MPKKLLTAKIDESLMQRLDAEAAKHHRTKTAELQILLLEALGARGMSEQQD